MADKEKFNVFPTRMSMQLMKARLKVAEAGYKLLKQKVDALRFRYREIAHEIIEIKYMLSRIMTEAAYLLAETKYVTGDIINYDILHRVSKARLKVRDRVENIAGVEIRVFECFEAGEDEFTLTGLAKGGEKIQQLKKVYALATDILVQQATLENAFKTLDEVIRSTNRRVNALDCRYIPKVKNTLKFISETLDEEERNDYYRMKIVKNKKIEAAEEKEALRKQKEAAEVKEALRKQKEAAEEKEAPRKQKEDALLTDKEN